MTYKELNEYRRGIYLTKEDIRFIHEHGLDGFYAIVAKQTNLLFYPEELEYGIDYESNDYALDCLLKFPKMKEAAAKRSLNILIEVKHLGDIEDDLLQIIDDVILMIPNNNFIILKDTSIYQKNADILTYREIERENVFLSKLDCSLELEFSHLLSLIFRNVLDRIVFERWNDETNKKEYVPFTQDMININIEGKENVEELRMIFASINKLINRGVLNKVLLKIKVNNMDVLRNFDEIFTDENSDKIFYTVDVSNIDKYDEVQNVGKNKDIVFHRDDVPFDSWDKYVYFERFSDFVLSRIPANASDMEKVLYISKFISNYLSYDFESVGNKPKLTGKELSYYDIVNRRKGVCRHISWLTNYFLNKLGIPSKEIDIGSSDQHDLDTGVGHAINMVYLDGVPYFIDNTGNLGRSNLYDSPYFLVSSEDLSKVHQKYADSILSHDCPRSMPMDDLYQEECKVNEWSLVTDQDLEYLQSIGQQNLVDYYSERRFYLDKTIEDSHDNIYEFLTSVSTPRVFYKFCGSRSDVVKSITLLVNVAGYNGMELYDKLKVLLRRDNHCKLGYSAYHEGTTMEFLNTDKMTLGELQELLSVYTDIMVSSLEDRRSKKDDGKRY